MKAIFLTSALIGAIASPALAEFEQTSISISHAKSNNAGATVGAIKAINVNSTYRFGKFGVQGDLSFSRYTDSGKNHGDKDLSLYFFGDITDSLRAGAFFGRVDYFGKHALNTTGVAAQYSIGKFEIAASYTQYSGRKDYADVKSIELGVDYRLTDAFTLGLETSFNTTTDQGAGNQKNDFNYAGLRVSYDLPVEGLSLYGRYGTMDIEGISKKPSFINIGLTYQFGKGGTHRPFKHAGFMSDARTGLADN
ncbi:MAG: porin [Halocynthiibacter sp.]